MNNKLFLIMPIAGLLVSGCATLTSEDDRATVAELLDDRVTLWEVRDEQTGARIRELLDAPLGPGEAVRVAMLANPEIRLAMARAGLARADVIRASRLPNPRLSLSFGVSGQPGTRHEIEAGVAFDLIALLLHGARRDIAQREYDRDLRRVAHQLVELATRVEIAWFEHVSARQVAQLRAVTAEAAELSAELAERYYRAGNLDQPGWLRELTAASQARLALRRGELEAQRTRLALQRLMGLSHSGPMGDWQVLDGLPGVLDIDDSPDGWLAAARNNRLDVQALQTELATLDHVLSVVRRWRWVTDLDERHLTPSGDVDIGASRKRGFDGSRSISPAISLRPPLFDQGQAAVARAQSRLARARADLEAALLDVEHEVLDALAQVQASRDIAATYRDQLIPQRQAMVERSQEQFNFMFTGAFELLATRQQEYTSYQGYVEAVRDFWVACVRLSHAAGTTLALQLSDNDLLEFDLPADASPTDVHEHHHHH